MPRSTGLRLCTATLGNSVEYLYDFTIGYTGIEANDIPEQVYTIQSIFFFQHFPKGVHVHVRRFKTDAIPQKTEEEFNHWIQQRWEEKDQLMAHFYKHGEFPDNKDRTLNMPIRLRNPAPFLFFGVNLTISLFILRALFYRCVQYYAI